MRCSSILNTGEPLCPQRVAALKIYPPDNRNALFVPVRLSACFGALGVNPLVAGTTGE